MSLINCEVSLTLTWSANCVITSMRKIQVEGNRDNSPTGAKFKIKDKRLYVPVVTLSAQDDNKLLERLNPEFKRTIKGNKYKSEMSNQDKTDNLNYLVDPTFTNANKLFVLSFENQDDVTSDFKYYTATIEITDFNVLIDGKSFFDVPVKKNYMEQLYEKTIEMSRNNDYTTGNLLDYEYFSKHYKLIAIDLSRQI